MAAFQIKVDIDGFNELNRTLSKLSDDMWRKYARKGVMTVARKMRELQRSMAPVSSGLPSQAAKAGRKTLKQAIAIKPSAKWRNAAKHRANGIVGASIGARWPDGAHASLLEFGFMQQTVAIRDDLSDEVVVLRRKTPKQIPPQPFIRPAFDALRPHQNSIFADVIKKAMQQDLRKTKKR